MVRQSKRILFPVRNGFCCGVDEVGRGEERQLLRAERIGTRREVPLERGNHHRGLHLHHELEEQAEGCEEP